MKLKLTTLIVGDVELTKRQCLHNNTTASTPSTTITATIIIVATTTTATKDKATGINSAPTATTITAGATNTILLINLRV